MSFTSVLIGKQSKRNHIIAVVEIKVFLNFFACRWREPVTKKITDPDPEGPKTYGSGSTTLTQTILF
jgi:hypothetical protein